MGLSALLLLFIPLAMAQPNKGTELPDDFPRLGFSLNVTYHHRGFRFGRVLSIRRERPPLRTFEGELMIGLGTNPGKATDRICVQRFKGGSQQEADEACELFTNPVRFSTLSRVRFDKIRDVRDQPMLLYFTNFVIAPTNLLTRTNNRVRDAFPIQPDLKLEKKRAETSVWTAVHPVSGALTGRIVQASLEGPLRKTYEVVIQESENANNFRAMSVNDGRLFRFITHAMLTGKPLRIEYVEYWGIHGNAFKTIFTYATNFRVVSVEILEQ